MTSYKVTAERVVEAMRADGQRATTKSVSRRPKGPTGFTGFTSYPAVAPVRSVLDRFRLFEDLARKCDAAFESDDTITAIISRTGTEYRVGLEPYGEHQRRLIRGIFKDILL